MCIVIICYPVRDVLNFEINHSLLIKAFFYITKSQDKNVNISRTKKAIKGNWSQNKNFGLKWSIKEIGIDQ